MILYVKSTRKKLLFLENVNFPSEHKMKRPHITQIRATNTKTVTASDAFLHIPLLIMQEMRRFGWNQSLIWG